MLAEPEHYKGILFIRISTLPGDQKTLIRENYNREAIIKILKEDALLNDCILYSDYLDWYKQFNSTRALKSGKTTASAKLVLSETAH